MVEIIARSTIHTHATCCPFPSLFFFPPSFFFFLLLLSLSPSSLRAVTLQLTEEKAKESESEREGGRQPARQGDDAVTRGRSVWCVWVMVVLRLTEAPGNTSVLRHAQPR